MSDWVGGRKYDVECGVVRWGPIGSDRVIIHTGAGGEPTGDCDVVYSV